MRNYHSGMKISLRHDSMLKSIKSVESLDKKGVATESIFAWQQIFDSFGDSSLKYE